MDWRRPAAFAGGARATKVSLTTTGWAASSELPLAEWAEQGRRLGTIGRAAGWWIGDWLRYGNERYGERYARAARITGYDVQTLMNMVYVASRIEPSRRREGLSFSHHAEVAALERDAQDHWLARAEADRLSVRCLRDELRRERNVLSAAGHEPSPQPPASTIVCPECGCRFHDADESNAEAPPPRRARGAPAAAVVPVRRRRSG